MTSFNSGRGRVCMTTIVEGCIKKMIRGERGPGGGGVLK